MGLVSYLIMILDLRKDSRIGVCLPADKEVGKQAPSGRCLVSCVENPGTWEQNPWQKTGIMIGRMEKIKIGKYLRSF
jgi:hypothetical protein